MPWASLPPGPGSGTSWIAHPEAYTDGPAHAEPLDGSSFSVKSQTQEPDTWGGRSLEEDAGAALCDFIRSQARLEPSAKLRITGDNGAAFDFTIDLTPVLAQNGRNVRLFSRSHWAVYRDRASRIREHAIQLRDDMSVAAREWRAWLLPEWERGAGGRQRRHSNVHPPWSPAEGGWRVGVGVGPWKTKDSEREPLVKLGLLRRWCDAYESDRGFVKSFTLKKEVWGWDMDLLRRTIQHRIWASGCRSYVDVEIECDGTDLRVEPDNALVRFKRNRVLVVLAWITLLYPLFWVLLHLFDRHGAAYDQAVASYALKLYPALPGTHLTETLAEARGRLSSPAPTPLPSTPGRDPAQSPTLTPLSSSISLGESPSLGSLGADARLVRGPQGVHVLVGVEEAEWLRHWEDRILQAVRLHIKAPLDADTVWEVREVGRGLQELGGQSGGRQGG